MRLSVCSTVIHERGSPETIRDPRGFAVKFYTREGNFDMVGNNMPVSCRVCAYGVGGAGVAWGGVDGGGGLKGGLNGRWCMWLCVFGGGGARGFCNAWAHLDMVSNHMLVRLMGV
jgi:hypothetical protein